MTTPHVERVPGGWCCLGATAPGMANLVYADRRLAKNVERFSRWYWREVKRALVRWSNDPAVVSVTADRIHAELVQG